MSSRPRRTTHARAMSEIEAGLRSLSKGLRILVHTVGRTVANGRAAAGRRRVSAALRLQGRYMGLIRTLPGAKKARVRAIRASKGVQEAIRLAKEMRA